MPERIAGLSYTSIRDYLLSPIPSEDDDRLREFVADMIGTQQKPYPALSDDVAWRLLTWAQRAATLAVRESSESRVREGLTALVLEGGCADFSASLETAALLYDACIRIGSNPMTLFAQAAALNPSAPLADDLFQFPDRPPNERTIDAWGYGTVIDQSEFRYKRRW